MNKLPLEKRVAIISALVEGNSLRSTSRMVGVSINTVTKLLVDIGRACSIYQDRVMRNLTCQRLQIDEIWSFCYCKEKNVPDDRRDDMSIGDVWTFAAIDADTKLVPHWLHGQRSYCDAKSFVDSVAARLLNRVQVTTDGHKMYLDAMDSGFSGDVDYAMLIKHFGGEGSNRNPETRYSPGECCGTEKRVISGEPDEKHISTSYIERQNLTMRMKMRRFTRLTNGFSKKLENLMHAVSLHYMHYNFVRRHQTIRMPPALKAHVTDHVWTLEEVVALADDPSLRANQEENSDGEISN
jgi:IS1 family transposase